MPWSRRFNEPLELPDGKKLRTLKEAIAWLAKDIPRSEHTMPKVQAAARMVTDAAENNGPMIFADRHDAGHQPAPAKRVRPSAQDNAWGKRKFKRGE
jgi:hypothetical protein